MVKAVCIGYRGTEWEEIDGDEHLVGSLAHSMRQFGKLDEATGLTISLYDGRKRGNDGMRMRLCA